MTRNLILFLVIVCVTEAWIQIAPATTKKKHSFSTKHNNKPKGDELYGLIRCCAQKKDQNDDSSTTSTKETEQSNDDAKEGIFDFILNPYESKIPKQLKDDIYKAEGNTQAAKDRRGRIATYALIAFIGILCAFFNVFLTELRAPATVDGIDIPPVDLQEAGFGWVQSNFVFQFLFLNKIGGGVCILGGAGAGLLAEAEFDTRRINAEKIYEEMERRRDKKLKKK